MPTTLVRKPKTRARLQTERAKEPELAPSPPRLWRVGDRRYIYGIIDCDEPKHFDCDPIGDGSGDVHAAVCNGVAALVSTSAKEKYTIDRQNTLAHQRVMEHVMEQGHTVLPVKFDTIAEAKNGMGPEERIVRQVLVKRFDEFSALLGTMSTRVEVGVKALWRDMNAVFREIVDSNDEIKRLRSKIAGRQTRPQFGTRVKLGEMVKKALDAKTEREQKALLAAVRDIVVDFRKNKTFGDQMFANLALLLEKSRAEELDRKLDELADAAPGRIKLKYVGPVPPSNFIELVIRWDE